MNNEIKEILDDLLFTTTLPNVSVKLSEEKLNQLKDYINNLQEENNRLKELCDKYEEEHSTTFEYWKRLVKEDYKSRNEKAIEYIKENQYRLDLDRIKNELLEILGD